MIFKDLKYIKARIEEEFRRENEQPGDFHLFQPWLPSLCSPTPDYTEDGLIAIEVELR